MAIPDTHGARSVKPCAGAAAVSNKGVVITIAGFCLISRHVVIHAAPACRSSLHQSIHSIHPFSRWRNSAVEWLAAAYWKRRSSDQRCQSGRRNANWAAWLSGKNVGLLTGGLSLIYA